MIKKFTAVFGSGSTQDMSVVGTATVVTSLSKTLDDGTVVAIPPLPVPPVSVSPIERVGVVFDDGHSQALDVSGTEDTIVSMSVTDENGVVSDVPLSGPMSVPTPASDFVVPAVVVE